MYIPVAQLVEHGMTNGKGLEYDLVNKNSQYVLLVNTVSIDKNFKMSPNVKISVG